MKSLLLSLALFFTVNIAVAQRKLSVEISLKDGSKVKGTVIEYRKDDYIILEIGDERNLKFLATEISTIDIGSNSPAGKNGIEKGENNNQGIKNTNRIWSFGVNQLIGIGIGEGNSKLLNMSPALRSNFSVSSFLQIGLGIGYSNIQSNEKNIILRSGSNYAYPNGTDFLSVGIVNPTILQTVSSTKATNYELINSQITFRINHSSENKTTQLFTELGIGFGYAPTKNLNIEMESEVESGQIFGYDPITGLNYRYYSFQYFSDFEARYSNAFLIELGSGVKFKTIKKQHLELKLSYQNTRGNINYTHTRPYAKSLSGILPSYIPIEEIKIKGKDFLNLSFIAFSVGYSF
jgi:hypothetical protein